jgi:hypothetical protein
LFLLLLQLLAVPLLQQQPHTCKVQPKTAMKIELTIAVIAFKFHPEQNLKL